jgi:histidine phosphotransferase ChpT
MTVVSETALAEFMTTKFCHDLAGPLGAVGNGVEFLQDEGAQMQEQSLELIEISAKEAIARLLFFRQAFGASNRNMDVEMSHIHEVCDNFFKQKNISVTWHVDELFATLHGEVRHQLIRLVLNAMMAASGVVIRGAQMLVEIGASQKQQKLLIKLEQEHLKEDPLIEGVLCGLSPMPDMDSRNVQIFFTAMLAEQMKMKASVKQEKGRFLLELKR